MANSDLIALAACAAAFLALIPQFSQMLSDRKSRGKKEKGTTQAATTSATPSASATAPVEPRKLNGFGRALVLTSVALAIGVVELVLFSAVAEIFGIAVDVNTMPTNWLVAFYALFLVPGLCLLMAFAHLTTMFD